VNENIKKYLVYAVVLLAVGFAGYWLYLSYVSSNGIRDADIKQQLETLSRNQQLLTTKFDGLTKDVAASQRRVDSIASRIANAENGVSEVAGKLADSQVALTESAGLIDENERIIQSIQQRAKTDTK